MRIRTFANNKAIKNPIVCYTFLFLLVIGIGYMTLWSNGLVTVWRRDSLAQYYPAFLYIGEYLRTFLWNIMHGRFSLPVYDLSIAMGEDIWGSLNYYGMGDPINLLAVFANHNNGGFLFSIRYVLGLYFIGISFQIYCKKMHISEIPAMLGSLIYVFSGFSVNGGLRYIGWLSVLFYFPLMLAGIEDILKAQKRFGCFLFAVVYGALCGFYFLYMSSLALLVYCVIRVWFVYDVGLISFKRLWEGFVRCLYAVWIYLLGILLAAPIFLPSVSSYLFSERNERVGNALFIVKLFIPRIQRLIRLFVDSMSPDSEYNYVTGILIIEWVVVFIYLVVNKSKQAIQMRIAVLICLLAASIEFVDYLFNAFVENNNRWIFLVHFTFAVVFASALSQISELQIAWNSGEKTKVIQKESVWRFIAVCLIVNLVGNLWFVFAGFGSDWKTEFFTSSEVTQYVDSPYDYAGLTSPIRKNKLAKPENQSVNDYSGVYRVSMESLTDDWIDVENVSMLHGYPGLSYWFSIINQNTQKYVDDYYGMSMYWRSFGFAGETYTEALAGCKYYCSHKKLLDSEYRLIQEFDYYGESWYLYENPYYRGFSYCFKELPIKYEETDEYLAIRRLHDQIASREGVMTDRGLEGDAALQINEQAASSMEAYNRVVFQQIDESYLLHGESFDNEKGIYQCDISATKDGMLVVVLPYSSFWVAKIDDKEVPVEKWNMYMAIKVSEGEHHITFTYKPIAYRLGLIMSILALVILGSYSIVKTANRRRG